MVFDITEVLDYLDSKGSSTIMVINESEVGLLPDGGSEGCLNSALIEGGRSCYSSAGVPSPVMPSGVEHARAIALPWEPLRLCRAQ